MNFIDNQVLCPGAHIPGRGVHSVLPGAECGHHLHVWGGGPSLLAPGNTSSINLSAIISSQTVDLPLSLVVKPCPPIKDADFKVNSTAIEE